MRRAIPAFLVAATAVVVAGVLLTSGGGTPYRVAAVFDDARGLVAGQQVKIAGAVVGSVESVHLTRDLKARVQMSVTARFAPFRADATCAILPEGLISENFVQCDPGRSNATLPAAGVPLSHTTVPFSVQDLLGVFALPTDERLRVLISELGIATSGRGQNLNGLLRRADPALVQARRVLAIVNGQRARLADAVAQTDQIVGRLATSSGSVRGFVDHAAALLRTTAVHRGALGQGVGRLPGLLEAARPALASLDRTMANGTPLLTELRQAAPGLTRLTTVLPAFTDTAAPALKQLGASAARGTPAVRAAIPLTDKLLSVAGPLQTLAGGLDKLLVSARGAGALEGILRLTYVFATESAMYDSSSHIGTFLANLAPQCIVAQGAGEDVAGCAHRVSAPGQGELPVNEPGCGAKSGAWLDQTCPNPPVGPFALRRGGNPRSSPAIQARQLVNSAVSGGLPSQVKARALLSYLLK